MLPDAEARHRAATDFTTNLVVLAGAGTGKTSLLVERALIAIGSGVAGMDQLAAITFTEKAAGELRERLAIGLDRLRGLAAFELAPDPSEEADRAYAHLIDDKRLMPQQVAKRALAAMDELDRGTVSTIHAFCSTLLRAHPVEAGVDPDFSVDSGEQIASLSEEIWEGFATRELGPEAERAELWRSLLGRLSLGPMAAVAAWLGDFGIPDALLRRPFVVPDLRTLFGEEARLVAGEIEAMLERQSGMSPVPERWMTHVGQALGAFSVSGLEGLRAELGRDSDIEERVVENKKPTPNKKLEGVSAEEFKSLVRRAGSLARRLLLVDDALAEQVHKAIAPFAREFRREYLRRGFVSFDGLLALTRDLLRDHPDVRRKLKARYRLLLVDEFQDTDPLQYEIVLLMAERPEGEASDAYEAELDAGRLFAVGDAKQSIYRFRGADYAAYRRAVERIVDAGGAELHLVANFRSVRGVIEPVNRLFEGAGSCWASSPHQPDYVPIAPAREQPDDDPRVELWTVDLDANARAEERREAEGRLIAAEIERRVASGEVAYRGITLLFRAFANIPFYLRPLRERGIPFVVDGGRDFLVRPEVGQLIATLRTLAQPSDPPALLAFLRSPAGGVSDPELAAFAAERRPWDWRNTRTDAGRFPQIARCLAVLRRLSDETRHLPADRVIRRVIHDTDLLTLGAAAFEGPQRVANLRKLANAAGELARDGKLSLDQVVEALQTGRLEDIQCDRPLADDAADAVRITSIHRMKGLENDWIFLPDLARMEWRRGDERDAARLARLPDGSSALALRVGGVPNGCGIWFERENERHDTAEEVRVFYVATTRARERLVVIAGPSRYQAPWVEALAPWGYDRYAPPADGERLADGLVRHRWITPPARGRVPATVGAGDESPAVERYTRAVAILREQAGSLIGAPSGTHEETDPTARRAPADRRSRELGRATGIVTHRLLERWEEGDSGEATDAVAALCERIALEEHVDAGALLTESKAILERFVDSGLAAELVELETLGREVPIIVRRSGEPVHRGTVDLLYRDDAGRLVVADYKTDRETDESVLRERYGAQLEIYADAVKQAFGLDEAPRAEIWSLRGGERIEVLP